MYICDRTGSCQAEHEVKICCCLSSFCSARDLVVAWYYHTIKHKAFCIALLILSSLAWHWGETLTILSTFALEQYRAGSYSRKLNPREAPFYQTLSAFSSVFIILFISPVLPDVGWEFPWRLYSPVLWFAFKLHAQISSSSGGNLWRACL